MFSMVTVSLKPWTGIYTDEEYCGHLAELVERLIKIHCFVLRLYAMPKPTLPSVHSGLCLGSWYAPVFANRFIVLLTREWYLRGGISHRIGITMVCASLLFWNIMCINNRKYIWPQQSQDQWIKPNRTGCFVLDFERT